MCLESTYLILCFRDSCAQTFHLLLKGGLCVCVCLCMCGGRGGYALCVLISRVKSFAFHVIHLMITLRDKSYL